MTEFSIGDRVYRLENRTHTGIIVTNLRVRWDNGWLEDVAASEIRECLSEGRMTLYDRKMSEISSGKTDFGFCDKKGRSVGYAWRIFRAEFTPVKDGQKSGYTLKDLAHLPREHLMIASYPTRDGHHYGASSGYLHCVTEAEAQAMIMKRIKAAQKRDSKRFVSR